MEKDEEQTLPAFLLSEQDIKNIAVNFFQHWWNSPGNNTGQGFDAWWKEHKEEFIKN